MPGGIFLDTVFRDSLTAYGAILLMYKDPEKRTSVLIKKLREARVIPEKERGNAFALREAKSINPGKI
jgi:hypothetical protein